ncbi:MAG: hypothetical protein GWP61_18350 [Chloroflexi bacterium]|jgi:hypothetical protein|nr:hypothetical protein [Chloroflexota bacterium]
MKEKAYKFSSLQQIMDEFKIIALIAIISTAAVWLNIALDLLWTAATFFGFMIFISLLYFVIGYSGRSSDGSEETNQ